MHPSIPSLIFPLILVGTCTAQTLKLELKLFDKPSGATQGEILGAGTNVKILARQGFWVQVDVGNQRGWLKASALSFSKGPSGAVSVDTGRLGTDNIVSVSAARGLSAKDLLNGAPKPEEVAKLNQLIPDPASVKAFIAQGRITKVAQVTPLKAVTSHASKADSDIQGKRNPSGETGNARTERSKKANDEW